MKFSILSLVHNLSLQQAPGLPSLSRGYTGIQSLIKGTVAVISSEP